jgi:putative ABC transport system ATP-binding protein
MSTAADDVLVRAVEVVKHYGSEAAPVPALRGVSLDVRRGECIALLGRSGSGKSTLLNLLGGLDQATAGTIEVAGRDLGRLSRRELACYRLATVGMIFQSFNLIPSRTAWQNVELPMIFAGVSPGERKAAARKSLEAVGLGYRLHHRPAELSGGEHQRVAIARALVNQPKLLLADEPTGNLDSATAKEIMELLSRFVKQHGTTLILVTHEEELAAAHTDRIVRLHDGRLVTS